LSPLYGYGILSLLVVMIGVRSLFNTYEKNIRNVNLFSKSKLLERIILYNHLHDILSLLYLLKRKKKYFSLKEETKMY